ncbi:MAG: hypothetical protein A2050_08925 [Candidatus Rokubacteria bacterium GWA2_73_35]|nr:MAG: hypothetical protein A2050_08925 [Candidatus Rokubacteria bacterium GWA2_73_35]
MGAGEGDGLEGTDVSDPGTAPGIDRLSIDLIRRRLASERLGRHIYLFGPAASSCALARQLADAGAEEGTVVLAEDVAGLHLAVLLRPDLPLRSAARFASIATLALADTLGSGGGPDAVECTMTARGTQYVILGIGAEWDPEHLAAARADRNGFTATFLDHLDRWFGRYEAEGVGALATGRRATGRPTIRELP